MRTTIPDNLTNAQLIALLNQYRALVDTAKLRHGEVLTDASWLAKLAENDVKISVNAGLEDQIQALREQGNRPPFEE